MKKFKFGFFSQIIASFVLAIIVGIVLGSKAELVQPLGDLFLRLINFIIVPIIISTLTIGIASTGDIKALGRMGGKTIIYFLSTTFLAVTIGLFLGFVLKPGQVEGLNNTVETPEIAESENFIQVLLNIVPTNPFAAMVDANILQVIFFAVFIGIGITIVGDKAKPVYNFFEGFAEIMYKVTGIVMKFAPIGIFGLLAPIVGTQGPEVLTSLFKLLLAIAIGCMLHMLIVYNLSVKYLGNVNPFTFFKAMYPAMSIAFGTQSSAGTLPITIKNTEENLGVSNKVSSFVLPLGATINMDGQAIYIGIACLFTAQFFGIELSLTQIAMIALIATIGSIGTAGVPGAGIIMLSIALTTVNLPLEGIAIVAGIDRFLNMFSTMTNVTGDATAALFVNESEKRRARKGEKLDEMTV